MNQQTFRKQNIMFGGLICLTSYLFVALMGACVKLIPNSIGLGTIIFFQYLIAFILCLPSVLHSGTKTLKTNKFLGHLIRDVAGILTFGLFFLALSSISLTNAIVLRSTTPFWIPLILFFWHGDRISMKLWVAIFIGFIGVIFIVRPAAGGYVNLGTVYALASGFFMGVAALSIRRLSASEPAQRTLFYYCLLGAIFSFPFASIKSIGIDLSVWIILISIGILMYLIQYTLIVAFRYAKASVLAPISYTAILFSGILDWMIWNKMPNYLDLIGVCLVVTSGILSIWFERKKELSILKNSM